MWVRTLSLLPRVRVSCERCAVLAVGPNTITSKTTLLSVSNDRNCRQFTTTVMTPIASVLRRQKRFIHATIKGAAGQGCRQSVAVSAPIHRLNHHYHQQQEQQPRVPSAPDDVFLIQQNSEKPQELCHDFLAKICDDIKSELDTSMPPLRELAHYLFDGKGKYVRPQIVFLLAIVANKTVRNVVCIACDIGMCNHMQMISCFVSRAKLFERLYDATISSFVFVSGVA